MPHIVPFNEPKIASPIASQTREEIAFTDRAIKHITPGEKRKILWAKGLTGLGLRVSPSGSKSFVYMYKHETRDRMMTLGRYPKMSLAEALKAYSSASEAVGLGKDPAKEQVKGNVVRRGIPTLGEMKEDYIKKYAKPNKRSWKEDQRQLEKDVLPALGEHTKVNAPKKADIRAIVDSIVARGAPVQANRTLVLMRRFFDFAMERVDDDVMSISPCYGVKRPTKETPRETFLSLDEIRRFWINVDRLDVERKTVLALKFLLLTLQRESEVVGIHISELNIDAGTWTLPGERTKNKRQHLVPLSPKAIEIIAELRQIAPDSQYLFPGRGKALHLGTRPLQRAVAGNLKLLGVPKFTPHDLRRTGSTQLGAFKVPRFDRERLLNHTDQSIGAVYDLYEYEDEKRAAMTLWADVIESCASSKPKVDEKRLKESLRYRDYLEGQTSS